MIETANEQHKGLNPVRCESLTRTFRFQDGILRPIIRQGQSMRLLFVLDIK